MKKSLGKTLSFILILILLLSTCNFSIGHDNDLKDLEALDSIKDMITQEMEEIINNSVAITPNEADDAAETTDPLVENLKIDSDLLFKMYTLGSGHLNDMMEGKATLGQGISVDYLWMIPVEHKDDIRYLASLTKDDEGFSMIGFSSVQDNSLIQAFCNDRILNRILEDIGVSNTSQIKFVKSDALHLNMVYIEDKSNEFVITYSSNPEAYGLENGKLYSAEEFARKVTLPNTLNQTDGSGLEGEHQARIKMTQGLSLFIALLTVFVLCFVNRKRFKLISS